MDEGGFILDYIMPAGSSLEETNRVITHVEEILRNTPEVESTSRRTGLQLGLAQVTEANTGDISVKLKRDRKRSGEEVIADVRAKIKKAEPVLDVEFPQLLQDMIGDLTSAPEPVVIKLFAQDPELLHAWAPQVGERHQEDPRRGGRAGRHREHHQRPGHGVQRRSRRRRARRLHPAGSGTGRQRHAAGRARPAAGGGQRPLLHASACASRRARAPSLEAIQNTLLISGTGKTATLGSLATMREIPGQTEIRRENLQRDVQVTARFEDMNLGDGMAKVQQAIDDLKVPPSIHVQYGGQFEEQQKSFKDLVVRAGAGDRAGLHRAAVRVRQLRRADRRDLFGAALHLRRLPGAAGHRHHVQHLVVHGPDHGDRHRGQERHSAARCRSEVPRRRHRAPKRAMIRAGERRLRPIMMTALATVAGMIPLALALGAGSQMLQPLAIAVIGGILASMVLSLVVTPAVHYYIGGRRLTDRRSNKMKKLLTLGLLAARRIRRRRLQDPQQDQNRRHRRLGLPRRGPGQRSASTLRTAASWKWWISRPARWSGRSPNCTACTASPWRRDLGKGFITNGQSNSVTIFDLKTLDKTGEPATGQNPDAICYEPKTQAHLHHERHGPTTPPPSTPRTTRSSTASRSARSRRICAVDGAGKLYVNIENSSEIVEIDAAKPGVTRRASLAPCEGPSGLAIDVKNKKLFSVCGNKMMAVTDIATMKVIATPAIGAGTDGAGFDPGSGTRLQLQRRRRHHDHRQTGQRQV